MENFVDDIKINFSFLAEYGFTITIPQSVEIDGIMAVFTSPSIRIRLKQSHEEVTLDFTKIFTNGQLDNKRWITFCWIAEYLSGDDGYESNFFWNEKIYDKKIMKQIVSLSEDLRVLIIKIIDFFKSEGYEERDKKIDVYIHNRLEQLRSVRRNDN